MRYFYMALLLICITVISIAGVRGGFSRRPPIELFSDMVRQEKLRPEMPDNFFRDHFGSRVPPDGTVSKSQPYEDSPIDTGRVSGTTNWVENNPLPVSWNLMERGQERFQIFCAPCHGAAGDGRRITIKYNMIAMANFHDKRLIGMADGEIFNTITHGKNLMGAYGPSIPAKDRWAIIAYVRALQRSRLGTIDDVPADLQKYFKK
jgi:hypothetical protein